MSADAPAGPQVGSDGKDGKVTRDTFNSRLLFLFAAIGSAVGLGNIWRFPYVAYESGGGAFLVPYMIALLTAGIPLLWMFFALGHRFRGSAPLVFRRIHPRAEILGWAQVGISFFIAVYYAAIVGWALLYTMKSFTKGWGENPGEYFSGEFLQADTESVFSGTFVMPILITMIVVWIIVLATLVLDVSKGIGRLNIIFIPLLLVLFIVMVVRALFLDGASTGLDALFTPDWSALTDSSVWIAAYGQIFFSLSIGFGIMITYSSYLKPRSNLTSTGLVTAFANSSFEVLAGIGVFAALGFMSAASGVPVSEVATSGIGLAFEAFPTIINQMPAGELFGILFFASLAIAGVTSLISIVEVVSSAVRDKFDMSRRAAALSVGVPMAVLSILAFSATSGLVTLDVMDKFTNNVGIVLAALVAIIVVGVMTMRINELQQHLNAVSSFKVGATWRTFLMYVTSVILTFTLLSVVATLLDEGYGGYADNQVFTWGWLVIIVVLVAGIIMHLIPFTRRSMVLDGTPGSDFGVPPGGRARGVSNPLADAADGAASNASPAASSATQGANR
ncbi:MAG: sodium-dependent transporter [Corynebacterium sp.]|uniref:sodium-dependent transporter n=1 Tax=Corynebacterium sp. TaxID=1720 RepID=UPI003F90602F